MQPHAETRPMPPIAPPNHDGPGSGNGYGSPEEEDLEEIEEPQEEDESDHDHESNEDDDDLTQDGNSVVGISIGPMQRQMSSTKTSTLAKAQALQKSSLGISTASPALPHDASENQTSLRDKRPDVPPQLDHFNQSSNEQQVFSPRWQDGKARPGTHDGLADQQRSAIGRLRADSESGLKRYLQRLNLPSMPTSSGLQKFMEKHNVPWMHSNVTDESPRELSHTSTDQSKHWADKDPQGFTHSPTSSSQTALKDLPKQDSLRSPSLRPPYLRRTTSDVTLLQRAHSTASSLGDDDRWADVHEQVNVRFKAIKDSFADSATMKMPKFPELSFTSLTNLNIPGIKNKDSGRGDVSNTKSAQDGSSKGKIQSPNGHLMSPPAGIPKKQAATHPHFAKALKHSQGDLVILGGYRGSVLRQAEYPHRQCWVPIKVGLNIRKVNLEVGLEPEADERMPETIIPGGMLANIGPVDISRRLFKRLRSSANAKDGSLRIWDYGYDWRLNPLLLSKQLITFLEGLPSNQPGVPAEQRGATVVAHSLGGLITRHAVNQRPELFAGVVYAGVPQNCINVLGPLRNGDDVLLSSRVLTAQVNFTIRTSYALLPLDGKCFIDRETGEEYPVDFFDPHSWDEYRLSPVIHRPLPVLEHPSALQGGSLGPISNLRGSLSSVLPNITSRRNSSPKPSKDTTPKTSSPPSPPSGSNTESNHSPATAGANEHGTRNQPMAPQMNGLPPPTEEGRDPETTIRTAVSLPLELSKAYLARTLADVKAFKLALAHDSALEESGAYPPAAIIYGKSIPTVYGAQVKSREAIKHADAYDDLIFASGDGVVLARAAQLPDGYKAARGGIVSSDRGHISLLGDLEAVGRCLNAVRSERRHRLHHGHADGHAHGDVRRAPNE